MTKRDQKGAATLFADDNVGKAPKVNVSKAKPPAKIKPAPTKTGNAVAVHQPAQPKSLLEVCMWAATQTGMSAENVKAYLAMAKEQEVDEARVLYDEAMLAVQSEIPPVPRDAFNKHTKSWWARLESVSAKVDPVLRKHKFTLEHGMGEQRIPDHFHLFVDVTWNGRLASGKKASFTKRYAADIGRDDIGPKGDGTKSKAQGSGSVINYGRRYLKLMVVDAIVLGMDRDGAPTGAELCSAEEIKAVRKRLKAANIDETVVCEVYKVDSLDHLQRPDLPSLQQRIAQKEGMLAS